MTASASGPPANERRQTPSYFPTLPILLVRRRRADVRSAEVRERRTRLFQQLGGCCEARLRARVVHLLIRSRAADAANNLAAGQNRDAAAEREDVGDIALWRQRGIAGRALLEFQCGRAKHARGVRLAPRHVGGLRTRLFVAQQDDDLSSTIDDDGGGVEPLR